MTSNNTKPKLRFPQFINDWKAKRIDEITEKVSIPVKVNESELYQQIGIRSHGKGLFHKEFVTGKELGNKRVFWLQENLFVVNIVFAWEQAVAKTTKSEIGMIASHRFPMFKPLENILDLDFLLTTFLTKKGKALLELASPGGAGRNKTLGQSEFAKLKINLPTLPEQQKIAAFLTAVDEKIQQLAKKKYFLEQYKKGVMQKIFNQEIRFKDDNGKDFADWEEKKLNEVAKIVKRKLSKAENIPVMTISAGNGFLNQQERFSKVIAGTSLKNYTALEYGELAYNRGNSKTAKYGCIYTMKENLALVPYVYHCFRLSEDCNPQYFEYFASTNLT